MSQVFSGEDFDEADHICEIKARPYVHILTRPLATVARCEHDWPDDTTGQTDMNGSCTKCGMSFMLYIHSECP